MKRNIVFVFLLINSLAYCQYNTENLMKYWYYSQRFRDNFLVISSGSEQGTNIPATIVGEDNKMNWNDGNSGMQFYIGMLATEYRLLKDHGLNYQNTLNQLDYAIKAVERLDANAESYWNGGYCSNGYFIRDDVPSNFANWAVSSGKNPNFSGRTIGSTFTDYSPALDNSQDNVWNYLPNFALVVKLVDEPTIIERVKKLAGDMVNNMHGYDFFSCPVDNNDLDYDCPGGWELNVGITWDKCYVPAWIIRNPNTENLAYYGGHIYEGTLADHTGRQWGFAEAAKFITGSDHHYNGSVNERAIMVNMANRASNDQSFSFKQLFTTVGFYWEYINTRFDAVNPYHEHLPLVWSLLHQDLNIGETGQWGSVYENLLNLAPTCGPHYYSNGDHQQFWDFKNRLNSDQGPPENVTSFGDYGGVDYMLLHNLYWLVYHPVKNTSLNYPQPSGYGGNSNPAIIKGGTINSTEKLNSGANVSYNADANIILKPGFTAYHGATFNAKVNGSIPVYNNIALSPTCAPVGKRTGLKSTSYSSSEVRSIETSDIKTTTGDLKVEISPNPTNTIVEIKILGNLESNTTLEIYTYTGELIYSNKISNNNFKLDMTGFKNGIYISRIINGENTHIGKIIKE